MFQLTSLGHHSWLVEGARARLLVDPILTADWGFTPAVGLQVWPPRTLDLGAMPPIDAVLLSHEHEGHFEIRTLLRLDRRIPIYISARASRAMSTFLAGLGFTVHRLEHDSTLRVGDLVLHTMCPHHRRGISDEWEVLPYLVHDEGGDGSFFTHVDLSLTDGMWRRARTLLERPGLFAHSTNHNDFALSFDTGFPRDRTLEETALYLGRFCRDLAREWGPPAAWLLVGQGFSFGRERSFLNGAIFPFGVEDLAELVAGLHPDQPVFWPPPGTSIRMEGGEIVEILPDRPFVRALPPEQWPTRSFGEPSWLEELEPVGGRLALEPAEVQALGVELDKLAAYLHARVGYRLGYSLSEEDLEGREPTLAIVARVPDGAHVYAYEPQGCRFRPVDEPDPIARYAVVMECNAADLLATLRVEVTANTLLFGRSRYWQPLRERFMTPIAGDLLRYCHPLRHPDRFLALYERIRAEHPDLQPEIHWSGSCSS